MNYEMLIQKRDRYQEKRSSIPEYTLQTYEQACEIVIVLAGLKDKKDKETEKDV